MPLLLVFYLFVVGLASLLAEMILPVIFSVSFPILNVLGLGSALIPLVVIYASLELGDERAPILAGILGLLVDLTLPSPHRLGITVLTLSVLSLLIVSQAHKPQSHFWMFRMIYVLIGTFGFLLVDYLFTLMELGRWYWPLDVWSKITFASLLNLALCPFFFFLVGLPPRLLGWKPENELRGRNFSSYAR